MIGECRLVDFDANDHVNLLLLVAVRDEAIDGTQAFDIDVCVNATLGVHDEVAQKIGFDDGDVELLVELNNVRAIETMGPVLPLDIIVCIGVGQDFVSVGRILLAPLETCQELKQ